MNQNAVSNVILASWWKNVGVKDVLKVTEIHFMGLARWRNVVFRKILPTVVNVPISLASV